MDVRDAACCEKWAKNTSSYEGIAGQYPEEMQPLAQIERRTNGTWSVNGCCGGGCYVLTDVKFCPFCGAAKT